MKALVYHGPGERGWDSVEDPTIEEPTEIIVRIDTSTICGTDLHILKGDAYDTFADASNTGALKVVLSGSERAGAASEDIAEAALA